MGMAGRFLPKLASKMKPSTAINKNWENVTIFPHPGNCLQVRRKITRINTTSQRTRGVLGWDNNGLGSSWSPSRPQPGILLLYPSRFSCCSCYTPPCRDFLTHTCLDACAAIPKTSPAVPKEEASSHSLRGACGDMGEEAKEETALIGVYNFPPRHGV